MRVRECEIDKIKIFLHEMTKCEKRPGGADEIEGRRGRERERERREDQGKKAAGAPAHGTTSGDPLPARLFPPVMPHGDNGSKLTSHSAVARRTAPVPLDL